jgi:hypothetical protein
MKRTTIKGQKFIIVKSLQRIVMYKFSNVKKKVCVCVTNFSKSSNEQIV